MQPLGAADPRAVGPNRTVAVLGQGGMGRVLLGAAPDGRLLAIKLAHAQLARDPGFRARFRREVAASRMVSGAYTAAVVDADPEAATPWLASVFVPGPSLADVVAAGGAMPEQSVRHLAAGLAQALADIHRTGMVHRDLKPANVILAADGVRVIDFGIARAGHGSDATEITHTGAVIGSPAFMSPEQALGHDLTPASDMFSLGAILATACAGVAPFAGRSAPQTLYNVVHAEPDLDAVHPPLRPVVERCLAKDPAARPTPEELLDLLGRTAPTARPWPAVVGEFAAAQQAEVAWHLAEAGAPVSGGAPWPRVGLRPEPTALQAQAGRRWWPAWVAAGTVAVTVAVVLVMMSWDTGGGGPDLSGVPDEHKALPRCSDLAGKFPLPPETDPSIADHPESAHSATRTSKACVWVSRNGDQIDVIWDLHRTGPDGSGAEQAKEQLEGLFIEDRSERDQALGFGDEGHWLPSADKCTLYVRDGNLHLFVQLTGGHYERSCAPEAKVVGEQALAVMPR